MSPEDADQSLDKKHVKPFDITRRVMKGWIMVEPEGIETDDDLKNWIKLS